jgi:nucleotide-binding universal stress UspA family protein
VLHVLEQPFEPQRWFTPFSESDQSFMKDLGERNLRAAEIKLAVELEQVGAQGVKVETLIKGGVPADLIVQAANDLHAGLLVLGTHGRRGFRHLVLGSVAVHVLRHAPCPVMTVHTP